MARRSVVITPVRFPGVYKGRRRKGRPGAVTFKRNGHTKTIVNPRIHSLAKLYRLVGEKPHTTSKRTGKRTYKI